jgi:hypothetical protein
MSHRKHLPLGFLAVGAIAILAVIGVVNGLWSKNLIVQGTVETGDLRVDWTAASCNEFWTWPRLPQSTPDFGEYLGKDVGNTVVSIGDPEDIHGDQVLVVTLNNTYPSYGVDCELHWSNTGSIPVNFSGFSIAAGDGGAPLTGCVLEEFGGGAVKQLTCNEVTIALVDGLQDQIDPCAPELIGTIQCDQAAHSLFIRVNQPAEQSDCTADTVDDSNPPEVTGVECDPETLVTYEFFVKLCVAQWNEEATYEQCVTSPQHEGPVFEP